MTVDHVSTEPSWNTCMQLLKELPTLPLEDRAEVIENLMRNPSPGVRERALRVGVAVLPDETLIRYLRSDSDAVLRNAALEILKDRESRSFQLAVDLLKDPDPDIVLQSVLILDHIKDPRAVEPLRSVLHHDDPNVIQAAIVAIGHLGDARTISELLPFLEAETWLQMATVQALGDLRSQDAIKSLRPLLTDLLVGPLAAEAIAKIGGPSAIDALAGHWLEFHRELDPETSLGLLAHVLEGLEQPPAPIEGLRQSLTGRLRDPFYEVRLAAARCLLSLGAGPEDAEAVSILEGARDEPDPLPSCLLRREDLVPHLLAKPGILRSWGCLLGAKYPNAISAEILEQALSDQREPVSLDPAVRLIEQLGHLEIEKSLLEFYLSRPREERPAIAPLLAPRRIELLRIAEEHTGLATDDLLVLQAILGAPAEKVAAGALALAPGPQLAVLSQLTDRAEIMRCLPWEEWLGETHDEHSRLACAAAVESGLRELLDPLRKLLAKDPAPDLIRAVAGLGDRDSVPTLISLLAKDQVTPMQKSLMLESLGRIGGPEARAALQATAEATDEKLARVAYRALADCAAQQDDRFFRQAISHPDWYVRLAAAEVLGRYVRSENLSALSQLAADTSAIVARRALTALREEGQPA